MGFSSLMTGSSSGGLAVPSYFFSTLVQKADVPKQAFANCGNVNRVVNMPLFIR
jgi:hypothetical protein